MGERQIAGSDEFELAMIDRSRDVVACGRYDVVDIDSTKVAVCDGGAVVDVENAGGVGGGDLKADFVGIAIGDFVEVVFWRSLEVWLDEIDFFELAGFGVAVE